jgi:hypothetical protein
MPLLAVEISSPTERAGSRDDQQRPSQTATARPDEFEYMLKTTSPEDVLAHVAAIIKQRVSTSPDSIFR